jgi:hypothetical protein
VNGDRPETNDDPLPAASSTPPRTSRSIDWYAEGQSRVVEVDGVRTTVRFVGRIVRHQPSRRKSEWD